MQTTCSRCGLFHSSDVACPVAGLLGAPDASARQPGALIAGRYRVLHTIHRGGMSIVYLAEDTLQDRKVALKELRPSQDASPEEAHEAEAWFARESALLSVLDHPLIPDFYSVFREDGHSYIAQEYVPGMNLDERVAREGPVDEETVVAWGIGLCGLLDYLHTRPEPVVFRDLKPANILLRPPWANADRQLAVVDFGIARRFQHDAVGTVIGTPGYAPPEQYQGLATPQSDIYALGATLHRLLTGYDPEHPKPDTPLFTFPPVRDLNPIISAELAAIVARATALVPGDRYSSAEEFGLALRRVAARYAYGVPTRQQPASTGRRAWALMAAVLLVPLLLAQVARVSQVSFQGMNGDSGSYGSGYYTFTGVGPQVNDGGTSPVGQCTIPATKVNLAVDTIACGSDGATWILDPLRSTITWYSADNDVHTIAIRPPYDHMPSPTIVANDKGVVLMGGGNQAVQVTADGIFTPVSQAQATLPQVENTTVNAGQSH